MDWAISLLRWIRAGAGRASIQRGNLPENF